MPGFSHWLRTRSRWALAAGALGTAGLALSSTAALGGFTASVTNQTNTASTGSLVMKEVVGGSTSYCLSTGSGSQTTGTSGTVNSANNNSTCPFNKFGSLTNGVPGSVGTPTTVAITNVGSVPANSLGMTIGSATPCSAAVSATTTYNGTDTAGFCGKVDINIEDDTGTPYCVLPYNASAACPATPTNAATLASISTSYATTPLSMLPTGSAIAAGGTRNYKVTVGIDTSATNIDQGLTATMPITFTMGQ